MNNDWVRKDFLLTNLMEAMTSMRLVNPINLLSQSVTNLWLFWFPEEYQVRHFFGKSDNLRNYIKEALYILSSFIQLNSSKFSFSPLKKFVEILAALLVYFQFFVAILFKPCSLFPLQRFDQIPMMLFYYAPYMIKWHLFKLQPL